MFDFGGCFFIGVLGGRGSWFKFFGGGRVCGNGGGDRNWFENRIINKVILDSDKSCKDCYKWRFLEEKYRIKCISGIKVRLYELDFKCLDI